VDVLWFHQVYQTLGAERWGKLLEAARYASSAGGHKRAELFADAMLGNLGEEEVLGRIGSKRHQDSIRALGLLPLSPNTEIKSGQVLSRYQTVQEFVRGAKQFGAQRQESEKLCARIGLENLSRTAGYRDPARLEWAMEAQANADLAEGPISVTIDDVTVALSVNSLGEPEIHTEKKGKELKTIPPTVKKNEAVQSLVARRTDLNRQVSRMRASLESAMIRGDVIEPEELLRLRLHATLSPMLNGLLFVTETGDITTLESVTQDVRIAHPLDLLHSEKWPEWQTWCFQREIIQPFKQVFRELYVLTSEEKSNQSHTPRWAGQQVQPRQSIAILGKRGWINHYEDGLRKTYHEAGITAHIDFMGWTGSPLDVEGWTIETVSFTKKGNWKPLLLTEVPARIFSETMRDLDLIVSVAHVGGVDPEASLSTVEMRAKLVTEAARLLKLTNVRVEKNHILIEGHLSQYSVHLGSANVHRQPGGFVCIVPVHSQHRGRIFLPFADSDPRTAEVVSKTLLLARDKEIQDPTILEQIVGKAF
jgi:Family of unknown function (DUF5724)/Domain of unknown function (DUF4132)